MNIEDIQAFCTKLPAVTEDIKWENHLCFCVGEKMFLILGLDEVPTTSSFKVNEEDFEEIASRAGFKPAPYLARYKWVWTSDIRNLSKDEWEHYIKKSYNLVKAKLSKKTVKTLGILE